MHERGTVLVHRGSTRDGNDTRVGWVDIRRVETNPISDGTWVIGLEAKPPRAEDRQPGLFIARPTGATLALEAGASPPLVAFRLGHTSTRMVEQHYAGRLEGFDKEIAASLGRHSAARLRHESATKTGS